MSWILLRRAIARTSGSNQSTIYHAIKKDAQRHLILLAERAGFEPACRLPDNRISSAARYDHFDTFPCKIIKLYCRKVEKCGYGPQRLLRFATQDYVRVRCVLYHFDTFPCKIIKLYCRKVRKCGLQPQRLLRFAMQDYVRVRCVLYHFDTFP